MARNEPDPKTELDPIEARQAIIVGPMRYVLGFGLGGAVLALIAALWIFSQ